MTLRVLLVRHGAHDRLGKILCGRMDGVGLSDLGFRQADALGSALVAEQASRIFSSPMLRAQQTAQAVAHRCRRPVQTECALDEVDMGKWTGARFEDLAEDPAWKKWNTARASHRPPAGESMTEVQDRVCALMERLAADEKDETIIAVSHADVIKAACCKALDLSLDRFDRFDIDPCSVTAVHVGSWGMKLAFLNRV